MESLFTLAIFLQVLLPYSISSQKIGCIDGRQQSILARELEHWNCIPLGKSTSQKGPQWKQMDFLPLLTIGCQTQAASRTGFFCKLLLRQSIHLNKIFFSFQKKSSFKDVRKFAFKVPWEIVKLKVDKSPHLLRSTSSKGRRFSSLISRVPFLIAFRGFVASSRSRSRGEERK